MKQEGIKLAGWDGVEECIGSSAVKCCLPEMHGRFPMLQWLSPHLHTHGQHRLDSVGYQKQRHETGRETCCGRQRGIDGEETGG